MRYQHPTLPFYISTLYDDFDMELVHNWLSVEAYWSLGIPIETIDIAFQNSLAFGVFTEEDKQIGVARMITDRATFGYLADVFLAPEHRGNGLSKWLMEVIMGHPDLQGLRRTMLATRDMHKLYQKFGFEPVGGHPLLMEIAVPNIYLENETR